MRTFMRKSKATQDADPAKRVKTNRARSRRNQDVDSIRDLQQTAGNQAVQRLLQSETEDPEASSASSETGNPADMPTALKEGLEMLSGVDLSGVRVHRNSPKPAQLNAFAYTQGQDIYLGPGQEKYLPHEGWHAVQQLHGRVRPTIHSNGVPVNDDQQLEREADIMGVKAARLIHASIDQPPDNQQISNPLQRRIGQQTMGDRNIPQVLARPRALQRRAIANLPTEAGENILVRSRTVTGWRRFLTNADEDETVRELNAFMALAVGHSVYERAASAAARSMQADRLRNQPPPTEAEAVNLMVALLTVPDANIDLLEFSPRPLTGLLLRKYVQVYYQPAMDKLAKQAGETGGVMGAQIEPVDVAEFLQEAEESGAALRDLREQWKGAGQWSPGRRVPSRFHEVGATEAGPELADALQAQALAGAHATAAAALGEVFKRPDESGEIVDKANRNIMSHALVLRGIIERQDQIRQMNEAIINGALSVIFAGAGPLGGGLKTFGQVVFSSGMAAVKTATMTSAKRLAGRSGANLRKNARRDFYVGVQELENAMQEGVDRAYGPWRPSVEAQRQEGINEVHRIAEDLVTAFYLGTD